MKENSIHHLVVIENGVFLGMVSSQDILENSAGGEWLGSAFPQTVGKTMKSATSPITEEADLKTALSLMLKSGATALPLSRNGEIVGVITQSDLLRVLDTAFRRPRAYENVVGACEAVITHPLTQNFVKALADAGI